MMRRILTTIIALTCVAAHADLYRWVDADGKVQYSDQPPPASIKQVEKKKINGGKAIEMPLTYEAQQAVKNFPVTLFTSMCGETCDRARALLAKRGIPYTELDAGDPNTQRELRAITGGALEVPILRVGRDVTRGFEEGKWNTALDAAGYPHAVVPPQKATKPPKAAPPAAPPPPAPVHEPAHEEAPPSEGSR